MPGKLMALAGWPNPQPLTMAEQALIDQLFRDDLGAQYRGNIDKFLPQKQELRKIPWTNGGLETPEFRSFAKHFSDELFSRFLRFAEANLHERLPLLITGGCGLNCEWNTKWRQSGLFSEVFVPPCPNDSGSAIGTAADAQFYYTGDARLNWSVYSGEEFCDDCKTPDDWEEQSLDFNAVAQCLTDGEIIPWVQGRYEIGPRALGNRSLLASPFSRASKDRLNAIKAREAYRPIAPVCTLEDVDRHFLWSGESPYMLHFQKVGNRALQAIVHDDQSARVQTVTIAGNAALHQLLRAFQKITGAPVLCNTSLNWKACGFINRKSDLFAFADRHKLRHLAIRQSFFGRKDGGRQLDAIHLAAADANPIAMRQDA